MTTPERAGTGSAPLLSVVIPTHDVRPWIRQTLDSVREQQVDMEILVVDDTSSDGTREHLDEVAREDPRVRVVETASRGGGSARNAGADAARGRYLIFCDGDDIVPRGAYRALVESLERSGSDIAFGDYVKFRAADTWRPTDPMPAFDRPAEGTSLTAEPTLIFSRPCWNKAFRLDFWRRADVRFPDVPRSNDIRPMVEAYLAADRVDIVADIVYVYRERLGSGSMTSRSAGSASVVSYLEQEAACARLVADRGDSALSRAYAELVRSRDGFVHLARRLRETSHGDAEREVVEAVRSLLAVTPELAEPAPPLRELIWRLAADGDVDAARIAARAANHGHAPAAADVVGVIEGWHALLDALERGQAATADDAVALVECLARDLALAVPEGSVGRARELAERAKRAFGPRVVMYAPEITGARDAVHVDARVDEIVSGDIVVVSGSVPADASGIEPALYDAERGVPELVRPASVTWGGSGGRRTWSAAFPLRSLPMHRPLVPVVEAEGGIVSSARGDARLPRYRATDQALFDATGGVTVIRRRRHWSLRGMKRAAQIAVARLSR